MSDDQMKLHWAPRVPRHKIRRLYENDASGIVDEELLDEVAYGLYARCQSILTVTEASEGRVRCPRCEQLIVRRDLGDKQEVLQCPACSWQITWEQYFQSYQHKQLHGGGAVDAFRAFVEQFPQAQTSVAKMLLIDRLIHAVHWEMTQRPTRPAAVNLIEGTMQMVKRLLEELAYGEQSTPGAQETQADWRRKMAVSRDIWSRGE
ncbi:MAG: hypothetical protein J2P36_22620 [Ktedonobacteraceae bacterium]|nr:hypothetical protein [Ktedonobacteraceae bacterium]